MSILRFYKKTVRAINSIGEPFHSQVVQNSDDVRQRNKELYGFDAMDDIPTNGLAERYNKWLYSDDEEE